MTKIAHSKFTLALLFWTSVCFGQKVKYKELFGLLSSKQYEQAEPFLKRYLKDNQDNPNAFLYMGIIFQEKSLKDDVLKSTPTCIANMDSAIQFYDKAYKLITEKEIKRNDEYYQIYSRRDLRTGDFGVKLSDVQYDMDKRRENLRERIDKVKMVKFYFTLSDSLYKQSTKIFLVLQGAYPGEKQFYLRADDKVTHQLEMLSVKFDSCTRMFDAYRSSVSLLGKVGYNQALSLKDIKDFKRDGQDVPDFYVDDIQAWDYRRFATQALETITKEIAPIRDNLVTYDIELNKLREKMNTDSVSVHSDLTKLIDKMLMSQLKKFDPTPLPMEVFALKIADLEYKSSLLEHKAYRDSADIKLHTLLIESELVKLNKLDSAANGLLGVDVDEEVKNYDHFITNTFNNSIILKSYVKALSEYAVREKTRKSKELLVYRENVNWIIMGNDSIPLSADRTSKRFKPLVIINDKYTAGLAYADSLTVSGYLYNITYSHIPQVKVTYPLEKTFFKLSRLRNVKALTYSDPGGQIYFVVTYSDRKEKEKYPVNVSKIYKSDGLAWSNNYMLAYVPGNLSFRADTGELVLLGDGVQSVVDKNGKIK